MRRAVLIGLSVVALIGATALVPVATGDSAKHRKVVCLNGGYPSHFPYKPVYKRKPRHCVFTKNNRPPDYADSVDAKDLHWSSWSRFHARGAGKTGLNMVGVVRVKVKLYRVKNVCHHEVFTRARFRIRGQTSHRPLHLESCA
jgi:hypothetical protein